MNKINYKQKLIFMPVFLVIAADKLKIVLTKQLSQSFLCYMSVFFAILFASYFFRNDKLSTGSVDGEELIVSLRESVAPWAMFLPEFFQLLFLAAENFDSQLLFFLWDKGDSKRFQLLYRIDQGLS